MLLAWSKLPILIKPPVPPHPRIEEMKNDMRRKEVKKEGKSNSETKEIWKVEIEDARGRHLQMVWDRRNRGTEEGR
jgi:hypothetical protein